MEKNCDDKSGNINEVIREVISDFFDKKILHTKIGQKAQNANK